MKQLLIALCVVTIHFCGKQSETEEYTHIALLFDITDRHILKPDAAAFTALYDFPNAKQNGAIASVAPITDLVMNDKVYLKLPAASEKDGLNRGSRQFAREKQILKFKDNLHKVINRANRLADSTANKNNTESFQGVARALTELSKSTAQKRMLVCFSNLAENSALLALFNNETKNIIRKHPDRIEALLEKTNLLPARLDGIKVVFCYRAVNRSEEEIFMAMVGIYERLLIKRGAQVFIQSTNNFASL